MKPELEALLKAYDAFKQTPDGPEAPRLSAIYEAKLTRFEIQSPGHLRLNRIQHIYVFFGALPWSEMERLFASLGAF